MKCKENQNRKRKATHKLSILGIDTTSNRTKIKEIKDNSGKASSCTKQRKLKYGTPKKSVVDTSHLNILPRKEKKAAKRLLAA